MSSSESEDDDRRFNDEEDENGDIKEDKTTDGNNKTDGANTKTDTHLTSLLFGNIDTDGGLADADGEADYLGHEIRSKLGGLQQLLGNSQDLQLDEEKESKEAVR